MRLRDRWINFLHRAATGTRKTRSLLTPIGVAGFGVNSFSLVCIFTPLYVWINVWDLKEIEEPELVRRLGDDYIEYRRKTPMFVPG